MWDGCEQSLLQRARRERISHRNTSTENTVATINTTSTQATMRTNSFLLLLLYPCILCRPSFRIAFSKSR